MKKAIIVTGLAALASIAGPALGNDNHIDTIRSDAPELAQYGKYSLGVTTLKLVHPGQANIVRAKAAEPAPIYDRPLTVEVWYPARRVEPAAKAGTDSDAGQYRAITRDGKTEVTLFGRAVRGAPAEAQGGPYPLVILSHGYPGNRYLLSHLGENLASKGYVVASIDHTDSTYSDQAAFASTLFNRPLDQLFVLNEMARLNASDPSGLLKGLVNADRTALIGYSMGGYGVVNTIGGGFTAASVALPWGPPNKALAARQAGNAAYTATMDTRIKAAVAFAPGVRNIFEASVNAPRYLLTFENANHNAGAPIPAPKETWSRVPHLDFIPAEHYTDAVWDNARMNNIAQHFSTAFLGKFLKNDASMDPYLNVVEQSKDGKWSAQTNGSLNSDHSYWKGFPARTAVGLRLEQRKPQ